MFAPVNEISILVSALLAVAVGSIWYSPLLFGSAWMKSAHLSEDDLEMSRKKMIQTVVGAVILNGVLLFVIAQFLSIFAESISVWKMGVGLIVFLSASVVNVLLWEKRSYAYVLIHMGYASLVVFGGITIIYYWPW